MNANLKKVNIVQYDICNICDINQSQQKCEQCNKHMCLDIKCIDYNNNKICYECSQKNYDEYLKEQIEHGSLVKCDTCGYIWDGNAQCPCWSDPCWNEQINDSEEESHNEVIGNIHIIENENENENEFEPLKKKRKS